MEKETNNLKRLHRGIVTSVKMNNTAIVSITRTIRHKKYGKNYKSTKRYPTDTGGKKVELGATVTIEECRPLSKTKRWRIVT